ncbi:MAG: substrate-binding domain-containing protein [Opitutaceae bacterium]
MPQRQSLPQQAAAILREHLQRGRWRDWLPGERRLAAELRISRGTLRTALGILAAQDVIRGVASRGYRIHRRQRRVPAATRQVVIGLLSPEPLEVRRPYFAFLVDRLREAAAARGWSLQRHHGASYFQPGAEAHLDRLVQPAGCAAWVLFRSSRVAQEWFADRAIPALVSGHTYAGVKLPSLDVDHRAACRHAAQRLARLGHRHVALVSSRQRLPGLVEGETGFREGFRTAAGPGLITRIPFEGEPAPLAAAVLRVRRTAVPPTAIVCETPNQYLTVASTLATLGTSVPGDCSLLSRLDDPFLADLYPEPARYRVDPAAIARTLVRLLNRLVAGEPMPSAARMVVPDFIPGGSVAEPAPPPQR